MSALEVILAVSGTVVALLLFALEVHGRKMEHRSSRERIVIAGLVVLVTCLLTAVVLRTRHASTSEAARAMHDATGEHEAGTTTNGHSDTAPTSATSSSAVETTTSAPLVGTMQSSTVGAVTSVPSDPSITNVVESPTSGQTQSNGLASQNSGGPVTPSKPTCAEANTGHYAFKNAKADRDFSAVLDYDGDGEARRSILIPPGETQYFYDISAGRHKYMVTYRAMVPIMSFPPGAPTMPQDVIYRQGEIMVEQCQSGLIEIQ